MEEDITNEGDTDRERDVTREGDRGRGKYRARE